MHLIEDIETAFHNSKILEESNKKNVKEAKKNVRLNLMKLKDQHYQIDRNIFNIAIG